MVVAKNDFAHNDLALQIGSKTAIKEYVALVHGNITEEKGIINGNIGRHPIDRKKNGSCNKWWKTSNYCFSCTRTL